MKIKFLVFILIGIISLSCARDEQITSRPFTISVISAQTKDLSAFLYFTGIVRAQDEVKIYPRTEGKIYEKLIRKGETVDRNQILFTIDRDIVGYKFEKARVESPIQGRISMIYVDHGDRVTPQTPLALVQNDSTVKAKVWIGEKDYPRIEEGQKAFLEVSAYPDKEFQGKVSEVSPFFDPSTHTALTEIKINNSDYKLKPGMFAEIKIEVDTRDSATVVLFDSVLKDSEGEYVYIVEEDYAYKRYIDTGLQVKNFLEVTSGLETGDIIAYRGKEFLEDGSKVRMVKE